VDVGVGVSGNSLPDFFIRSPEDKDLNTEPARRGLARNRLFKRFLLGSVGVAILGLAVATGSSPAAAKYLQKHKPAHKDAVSKAPFGDIPKGPLEIFVSIEQQKLHFYSGGVHIADEPVATGVPGHLTPMGVFSVIQRDRYHHSNIYDNAPMPFMERITWSGVALHEGVGLGHPASHGCIRMPHDFAARLWMLPTMGMRVIIARPELQPLDFTDAHLFVHKDASTAALPATQTAQSAPPGTKSDVIEPSANSPVDASPASGASAVPAAAPPAAPPDAASAAPAVPATAANSAPPNSAPPQTAAPAAQPNNPAAPATAAPAPAAPSAAAANTSPASPTPASRPVAPTSTQPANAAASEAPPAAPANAAASGAPSAVPAEAAGVGTGAANIAAPIDLGDVPLPPVKPAQLGATSGGPIAIFVSRKESKIYVRQNFTPLFDAPVKIEDSSQPLGTHVFTAMDYLADHSAFHWTVVTLPPSAPKQAEHWKYVRDAFGRRKRVRVAEPQQQAAVSGPQDTPEEALARIQIPQDVINQISQLIVPGSSLVVSDQGLGPETGEGTDFIVVTR
jgi:L,D-transpeptidase catalytic domain